MKPYIQPLFVQEEVVVIGRITMDSESASAESSKLNEASLTIESSRTTGSGARVPLKFDPGVKIRQAVRGTAGLGFFPGAIVVLKGNNGSGDRFYVTEILSVSRSTFRQVRTALIV